MLVAARRAAAWRHGNAPDAIDDIECLADDIAGALEENPTSWSLRKLATTLGEFIAYITNNVGRFANYSERFRAAERITTGFVESAVNQIVDKRFDPARRASAASDPNTRPQRRSRSTHPSPLAGVQENGGQRPCHWLVMGSCGGTPLPQSAGPAAHG
ncbi:MAG TPA: hypothetical protein VFE41_34135 [Acetobacteraceae bacterium]|nr:hypothetical protein [Acetobacteraceae bacterium]